LKYLIQNNKFKNVVIGKSNKKVSNSNIKLIIYFREIELRENLIGAGFIDPPTQMVKKIAKNIESKLNDEMEHRVTVLGEIASATGFSS
jgi:endonuclease III-like uncharacterized protein